MDFYPALVSSENQFTRDSWVLWDVPHGYNWLEENKHANDRSIYGLP